MNELHFDLPLRITISTASEARPGVSTVAAATVTGESGLERVDIDQNYSNRKGYSVNFLGENVPLPTLSDEQRRSAAKNSMAKADEDNAVLPYHHFSIVMNRRRQLSLYTVVNIDGARSRKPTRSGDRWYFDPRIAQSEQIGEDLYARNALDRGHLVRRLDPAWGASKEALLANNDTFHFTNCSPQHAGFNQSDETWQGIENYLLNQATSKRKKLTIFTGPVCAEDDPLYRGVRLPVYFWKIAVYIADDDSLTASAFLLDQKELIDGLERFNPATFQVSIEEIQARTGIDFSYLAASQIGLEEAGAGAGLERADGFPRIPLARVSQISI